MRVRERRAPRDSGRAADQLVDVRAAAGHADGADCAFAEQRAELARAQRRREDRERREVRRGEERLRDWERRSVRGDDEQCEVALGDCAQERFAPEDDALCPGDLEEAPGEVGGRAGAAGEGEAG